jgi:hypothetical protein
MKTNITKVGAALLAIGTLHLAFTEYVLNSQTMVVRTEASSAPLRYAATKQTDHC